MSTFTTMTIAQRLAWLEAISTLGILAVAVAFLGPGPAPQIWWSLAVRLGIVAGICLASLYFCDLYNFETPHDFPSLFVRVCRALGWSALLLAGTYVLFPATVIPGNLASQALLALLVTVLGIRVSVYALAKRAPFSERVLIMGAGSLAQELALQIRTRADLALRVVGFVADTVPGGRSVPRLGAYADVADVVRRHRPDRIIVAMPDRRGQLPVSDLLACRFRGVLIEEGTQAFERFTRRLAVESLNPSTLIFGDGFRVTRGRLAIKRVLSVAIALGALGVSAPLMALVAVLIKLESPGPVFFIQERVGLHGRIFRLVKFRTMRELPLGECDTVLRDNESRVTRVGAVLRRYRLDEVPQFINILRGHMSLVGPRPEMAANVATFSALIPFYNLRHEVRPGLTGWAQVRAGYSMSIEEVTRKLCYDLYYIKHMSLSFDLRILFDTVKFVLGGKRPG
jgi:exopolysaccharide biosynthesis polyprenyl glycosylphosphotransferase